MAPTKNELLHESGYGTSSTYGEYNTYDNEGFSAQQKNAVNPFATNAGYAFSPEPTHASPVIRATQTTLAGSAICFLGAMALGFTRNAQIAQDRAGFSAGSSISAGICSALVALLLYGTVAFLMQRRENNGRMIGIGFALIGIVMSLIWCVAGFLTGGLFSILAAVLYLGVLIFNAIWLYQTNQPKLHRQLRK